MPAPVGTDVVAAPQIKSNSRKEDLPSAETAAFEEILTGARLQTNPAESNVLVEQQPDHAPATEPAPVDDAELPAEEVPEQPAGDETAEPPIEHAHPPTVVIPPVELNFATAALQAVPPAQPAAPPEISLAGPTQVTSPEIEESTLRAGAMHSVVLEADSTKPLTGTPVAREPGSSVAQKPQPGTPAPAAPAFRDKAGPAVAELPEITQRPADSGSSESEAPRPPPVQFAQENPETANSPAARIAGSERTSSAPAQPATTTQAPAIASTGLEKSLIRTPENFPAQSSPSVPASHRETQFTSDNHDRIVTGIRTQLLPRGGSMQIRLDPPNLGVLEVTVRMQDGLMNVSFNTSSEEASRLLSHSLSQLKHALEVQGVTVDRLHVQQTSRSDDSSRHESDQHREHLHDDSSARQEQQRREVLRRMWRRLALGSDPLDLVA